MSASNRLARLIATVTLTIITTACDLRYNPGMQGSGRIETQTRNQVTGFDNLEIAVGDVIIDQNGTESLTVEADDNLIPRLLTMVGNGTMLLITSTETVAPTRNIIFRISAKTIARIHLIGSGNVEYMNMNADDIIINLSGSGNIKLAGTAKSETITISGSGNIQQMNVNTESLTVTLNGSGDIELSGAVTSLNVKISGSGNFNAPGLVSKTVAIESSGLGNAVVNVTDTLDARLSGVGNLEYIGNPTVTQSVTGVGKVTKRTE